MKANKDVKGKDANKAASPEDRLAISDTPTIINDDIRIFVK